MSIAVFALILAVALVAGGVGGAYLFRRLLRGRGARRNAALLAMYPDAQVYDFRKSKQAKATPIYLHPSIQHRHHFENGVCRCGLRWPEQRN